MPSRPIIAGFFSKSELGQIKDIHHKKMNYNMTLDAGALSIAEFSFFGSPKDHMDIFGPASNLGYGRIDSRMNAVSPKMGSLSAIGGLKTQLALTFVSQAFNDFRNNLVSQGHGRNAHALKGSPYGDFSPVTAWQSVDTAHTNLLENIYTGYLMPFLRHRGRKNKVLTFGDFLRMFLGEFFNNVMLPKSFMLTRSGYSLSRRFTSLGSGLIIDLSSDDHNNDGIKYEKWLSHRSYNFVKSAAANFGFAIDKHAPWRLVANLQSPNMLPYIQGKGIVHDKTIATRLVNGKPLQASDVFNVFYDRVYKNDIEVLKRTVYNFYDRYVQFRPYSSSASACRSDDQNIRSRTSLRFREEITYEKMEKKYDDYFWLNQYFLIRLAESSSPMNQEQVERQLRKISYMNKYLGYDKALTYINEYVNMIAPPLAGSLFAGTSAGNLQITGQAAAIPADSPSGGGTTGY